MEDKEVGREMVGYMLYYTAICPTYRGCAVPQSYGDPIPFHYQLTVLRLLTMWKAFNRILPSLRLTIPSSIHTKLPVWRKIIRTQLPETLNFWRGKVNCGKGEYEP